MSSRALLELRQSNVTVSLRALILADTNRDAASIVLVLKQGGFDVNPTLVRTQQEFREAVAQEHFDAVLADYRLTDWSGFGRANRLRNSGKDIPFLMVAGVLGEEAVVESIKQGASDFILKEHVSRIPEALVRALAERMCATNALLLRRRCEFPKRAIGSSWKMPSLVSPASPRTAPSSMPIPPSFMSWAVPKHAN